MQAQRESLYPENGGADRILTLLADTRSREPRYTPALLCREAAEIARARRDPAAFAPLYERYADPIYGYCLRRTSDPEQAADLTAQIFTRALAAMPRYADRGGTFRSWLFSIAHNLLVDTYRMQRDITSLDEGTLRLQIAHTDHGPEHLALQGELRRAFRSAMQELTESQREVVELRLAGLTGPEIALVLNMKIAAVKSVQFRAYTRLRELLGPWYEPHSPNDTREVQP